MTRARNNGRSRLWTPGQEFHASSHESDHGTRTLLFSSTETLADATDLNPPITFPRGARLISWFMNVLTAPSGAAFKMDCELDGTTIFDSTLPEIAASSTEMAEVLVLGDVNTWIADGETLVMVCNTASGAEMLNVWLEVEMGESDD